MKKTIAKKLILKYKELNKASSSMHRFNNESNGDKEDLEESNSLKPSTKEETKLVKGSNKVAPEGAKPKKNPFAK